VYLATGLRARSATPKRILKWYSSFAMDRRRSKAGSTVATSVRERACQHIKKLVSGRVLQPGVNECDSWLRETGLRSHSPEIFDAGIAALQS